MDFAGVWFLISAETEVWILIGIALNLKIAFGRMIIFMVLIPWAWNVKDIFYQNYFQGRRVYFCTPVLVGSFVNLTEARVIWEDRTWIRKVSPSDWLLGMSVGRFLHSWLIWELSSPLWVAQVLDRWFWVALKKQTETAKRTKPINSSCLQTLLQFLPWVPALHPLKDRLQPVRRSKPFTPQVALSCCLYHSNRKWTRRKIGTRKVW